MMDALVLLFSFLKSGLKNQTELALENLALRQQLAILKRNRPLRTVEKRSPAFLGLPFALWAEWAGIPCLGQARNGRPVASERVCDIYWTRLSKHHAGRQGTSKEFRDLVRKMADANPSWGSPRIHGDLLKLASRSQNEPWPD
jgi:putative transposase